MFHKTPKEMKWRRSRLPSGLYVDVDSDDVDLPENVGGGRGSPVPPQAGLPTLDEKSHVYRIKGLDNMDSPVPSDSHQTPLSSCKMLQVAASLA